MRKQSAEFDVTAGNARLTPGDVVHVNGEPFRVTGLEYGGDPFTTKVKLSTMSEAEIESAAFRAGVLP